MHFKELQAIFQQDLKGVIPVITPNKISIPIGATESLFELTPKDDTVYFKFIHKVNGEVEQKIKIKDINDAQKLLLSVNSVTALIIPEPDNKSIEQIAQHGDSDKDKTLIANFAHGLVASIVVDELMKCLIELKAA